MYWFVVYITEDDNGNVIIRNRILTTHPVAWLVDQNKTNILFWSEIPDEIGSKYYYTPKQEKTLDTAPKP